MENKQEKKFYQKRDLYITIGAIAVAIVAIFMMYNAIIGKVVTTNPVIGFTGTTYENITIEMLEGDADQGTIVLDDSHGRFLISANDNFYIKSVTINGVTEDVSDNRSTVLTRYLTNYDLTLGDEVTISTVFKYGHADTGETFFERYPWVTWIGGGIVAVGVGFGVLWFLSGKEDKKKTEAVKEEVKIEAKKAPAKKTVAKKEIKEKPKKEDKK